jgi:uncharacterized protein YktA (UPF0223 family)
MPSHFKVHELMKDNSSELEELEAYARDPGRTVDECHEWMQAHGYTLSRSAVGEWLRKFRMTDRYRASGDLANTLVETAKAQGVVAISDATALQLQTMIFDRSLEAQAGKQIEAKELLSLSRAFKTVVSGKRGVEQLKVEVAAALATAEKQAKEGKSAADVVSVIKQSLGIST